MDYLASASGSRVSSLKRFGSDAISPLSEWVLRPRGCPCWSDLRLLKGSLVLDC